jgi:protein disulfide-isomerase
MKRILFAFFFSLFVLPAMAQHGDGLDWQTDLMKANEISKQTGKPIFGFFTGSDWCGWCHKLHNDVFSKPSFIKWANENVVLLELDFPRRKQLPENLMRQNNELQQAFQVQGYPTVWYFSLTQGEAGKMNINAYGNQGYPAGATPGKEDELFLKTANEIIAKAKPAPTTASAAAPTSTGKKTTKAKANEKTKK